MVTPAAIVRSVDENIHVLNVSYQPSTTITTRTVNKASLHPVI